MTTYDTGDVVLVRFPFTDLSSNKRRPALVISPAAYSGLHGDAVLLALTSQPQPDKSLRLSNWKSAGLPKPTWIKPLVGTLAESVIFRKLGAINKKERPRNRSASAFDFTGLFAVMTSKFVSSWSKTLSRRSVAAVRC